VSDIISQSVAVLLANTAPLLSYPFTLLSINAPVYVFPEAFCHLAPKPLTHIPMCCLLCRYRLIVILGKMKEIFFKFVRKNYNCEWQWFYLGAKNVILPKWAMIFR
jgi:hypothetical protein